MLTLTNYTIQFKSVSLRFLHYIQLVMQRKKKLFLNHHPKKLFFFFFFNLKKGKDSSILWSAYSVIHIICFIIPAVKHYMDCIYIDSDSNNVMIFISKI